MQAAPSAHRHEAAPLLARLLDAAQAWRVLCPGRFWSCLCCQQVHGSTAGSTQVKHDLHCQWGIALGNEINAMRYRCSLKAFWAGKSSALTHRHASSCHASRRTQGRAAALQLPKHPQSSVSHSNPSWCHTLGAPRLEGARMGFKGLVQAQASPPGMSLQLHIHLLTHASIPSHCSTCQAAAAHSRAHPYSSESEPP